MPQRAGNEACLGDAPFASSDPLCRAAGYVAGQPVADESPKAACDDDPVTETERVTAPAVSEPAPIQPGMVLAGRYAVERIIGRGGMGIVVRAHDRTLGEPVAIKILRPEYAGQRVWNERLAREVRLARQIHHPNVCRMFDFEQADGRVFVVMELAAAGTLRDEIAAGEIDRRPVAARLADATAVAAGLLAIHEAGIVHRDVSPQNVLRMQEGRLVLSDFGLATDPSESTTSLRGGTIAYMAPEIVRGSNATAASDVWALGIVIFEAMFGDKPRWKGSRGAELLSPSRERPLAREERAALEICRAATASEPGRRLTARQIVSRLAPEALGRFNWRRPTASVAAAVCAAAMLSAGLPLIEMFRRRSVAAASLAEPATSPMLEIKGEPADWTNAARVIGEIPDRVHCVVPLPDRRTVRIVWGRPRHAEDVDTRTGRRVPSPVVPAAYAEGCPDLSPDGKRLVFQGHTPDGRAFVYLAENPQGRDAVPILPSVEPNAGSEPRWHAGGRTLSYDVDLKHIGVFSLQTRRTTVLGPPDSRTEMFFRQTSRSGLFVGDVHLATETSFIGFDGDSLEETARFRLPGFVSELIGDKYGHYLGVTSGTDESEAVFEIRPNRSEARRVGIMAGQRIRLLEWADDGVFFTSRREKTLVTLPGHAGRSSTSIHIDARITAVADCGADLMTVEVSGGASYVVQRTRTGEMVRRLTAGPTDVSVSCSRDGHWFYVHGNAPGRVISRCDEVRCRALTEGNILRARVSADGSRLALLSLETRGPTVSWIEARAPGQIHFLRETETICSPTWGSAGTIWISRREGTALVWTEVDIASGKDTGGRHRGTTDCTDGDDDSNPPGEAGATLAHVYLTQLRTISANPTGN